MNQEGEVLKINIYGTEYPIKSDSETDTEYIRKVAEYVDKKMREIDQNSKSKSSLKVAILAALNITDELFQEKIDKKNLANQMQAKIQNLSDKLDQVLSKNTLAE